MCAASDRDKGTTYNKSKDWFLGCYISRHHYKQSFLKVNMHLVLPVICAILKSAPGSASMINLRTTYHGNKMEESCANIKEKLKFIEKFKKLQN
jgi:hypothetical protein